MAKTVWAYYLEDGDAFKATEFRLSPARIGKTIKAHGRTWEVWYVEEGGGVHNARCEPLGEPGYRVGDI